MTQAYLIYPHQLYEALLLQKEIKRIFLVEEPLLFSQYRFHKQKLIFHRASMKAFEKKLSDNGFQVHYIEHDQLKKTGDIAKILAKADISKIHLFDLVDDWLETRLHEACHAAKISIVPHDAPNFYLSQNDARREFAGEDKFLMASFYVKQRKRFNILLEDGKPVGGKWSFDTENRKKLPKGIHIPPGPKANQSPEVVEATAYIKTHFPKHYGYAEGFFYPITHEESRKWLDGFLKQRLAMFGPYQDAIAKGNSLLFHSLLSPLLNAGLLTPREVVDRTLHWAERYETPINCVEGFIRQVLGWREFVRGIYRAIGRKERTLNFWGHTRKVPESFWKGTTGIEPIDDVIQKVLETGYAHHIERLMVMANFMLLCEFDPDDVYRWFMELFIDAYDWVMVPNVYGMGLYADGGMITTKPYISGSNYIQKMSDYPKGEWVDIWTALYWNFIDNNRAVFEPNPRCGTIVQLLKKMDPKTLSKHKSVAKRFLDSL